MNRTDQSRNSEIAIIGIAGRFPGAFNVQQFWNNLACGVEAITFASDEELQAAGVDPKLIANPNYVRASSAIHEPDFFDASFFGYSTREAEIIDPQQRVFLECAWEALEDAACDPLTYPNAIGVFAGSGMNNYILTNLISRPDLIESVGGYQIMLSNDKDFLCTRVAYKLNLRGPAVAVQTACSTSLVAVQMAFESLLRRECDVALAGGVSIVLPQPPGYLYVPGMILSRDGHCRAFDTAASGTVPGSGAGIVVLKRLDDALADRDHIYAVIRGAAINNDGSAKVGYSAPSVDGQAAVIRRSMEMAGFEPESVAYVEAHGTGTEVGDPIEFAALSRVFASAKSHPESCALGSVKTNIGHLDTASGVTGLIKATLALSHRAIPPTLHFDRPNPLIDFASTALYVNTSLLPFDRSEPFRAGVSSFGIGGTNAHVSIEEAPFIQSEESHDAQLIVLSAKSETALNRRASQLEAYLQENPSANIADIAFTLQKGRHAFQHRQTCVATSIPELRAALTAPASPQMRTSKAPVGSATVAFLFPGQGSQYVNMGRDLYHTRPAFRDAVDRCSVLLKPHLQLDLLSLLYPEKADEHEAEKLLSQTAITQPAIFVIEYALASLWIACGICPSAMLGHSIGEYAAACIAGVFSLEDALALIAERGRLIQSLPSGKMLAVGLSELDLEPLLSAELSIAAINSAGQTVASGTEAAVIALEATLKKKNISCSRLHTSHAFHSPMMQPILDQFVTAVSKIKLNPPTVQLVSNLTGTWITSEQATDPSYWGSHMRNTVRFSDCAKVLVSETDHVLLEVGPGETLTSLIRSKTTSPERPMLCTLRPRFVSQNDTEYLLTTAGRLWLLNAPLNWGGLHTGRRRLSLSLPTYPFDRQRFWVSTGEATAVRQDALLRRPDATDWFYAPSWKRTVSSARTQNDMLPRVSLILSEDSQLLQELKQVLAHTDRLIQVRSGPVFRVVSEDCYEVNPEIAEDWRMLVRDLTDQDLWPERVIHAFLPQMPPETSVENTLNFGLYATTALIQALEADSSTRPIQLNVVSDRAYSVLGEKVSSPAAAALNAFSMVVPLECLNVTVRVIDVDLASYSPLAVKQVIDELNSAPSNQVVAYRGSARWLQTYEPIHMPAPGESRLNSIALKRGGNYLITGGLGGVGLVLAQHLTHKAGARLFLTSRTDFPHPSRWRSLLDDLSTSQDLRQKIQGLQQIVESGGDVVVLHVDASDPSAMTRVCADSESLYGPISGIIHAAGSSTIGEIRTRSREEISATLAAKVQGTEWIKHLLPSSTLDFVLLCSSISAIVPSWGLADYGAANAWLDGFAAVHDNPTGTRVLSVNWDTWREVGMAVKTPLSAEQTMTREQLIKHGILSHEAGDLFDRVLNTPLTQVVISTRDLAALFDLIARSGRISLLRATSDDVSDAHGDKDLVEKFVPDTDDLARFVVSTWQELLGVDSIGVHDNFFELGGHSLLGTQVLARIQDHFDVNLSLRAIFEAATPAELAERIRMASWAHRQEIQPSSEEREEIEF